MFITETTKFVTSDDIEFNTKEEALQYVVEQVQTYFSELVDYSGEGWRSDSEMGTTATYLINSIEEVENLIVFLGSLTINVGLKKELGK